MIMMKNTLFVAALLPFVFSFFGTPEKTKYTADDIRSVSISCSHMDYSHSFAFYLRKEEDLWLLDADFAVDTENPHTAYEACPIAAEDARELLDIVTEQDIPEKLRRYKKPKMKVHVSDETLCYTSILFNDGEMLGAAKLVCEDLQSGFYRLAEKYSDRQTKTEEELNNG